MATIDTIRKILEDNLSIEPEQVEEDTTLDSIDIDSLDLVELICDIEDAEGIDFGEPRVSRPSATSSSISIRSSSL